MALRESSYEEIRQKVGCITIPLLLVAIVALYFGYADEYLPSYRDHFALDESNVNAATHFFWDDDLDGHTTWDGSNYPMEVRFTKRNPNVRVKVLSVHVAADSWGLPKWQIVLLQSLRDRNHRAEIYFPYQHKGSLHRFGGIYSSQDILFCVGDVGDLFYEKDRKPQRFTFYLDQPKKAEVE